MTRLLLTRGAEWTRLRDWRVLEMAEQPHLLTCRKRAQMPACLTAIEAANVALKHFADAQVFMWDDPSYIPGRNLQGHKAIRVVGALVHRKLGR